MDRPAVRYYMERSPYRDRAQLDDLDAVALSRIGVESSPASDSANRAIQGSGVCFNVAKFSGR